MTDTPRTKAAIAEVYQAGRHLRVNADFAAKLETELCFATARATQYAEAGEQLATHLRTYLRELNLHGNVTAKDALRVWDDLKTETCQKPVNASKPAA